MLAFPARGGARERAADGSDETNLRGQVRGVSQARAHRERAGCPQQGAAGSGERGGRAHASVGGGGACERARVAVTARGGGGGTGEGRVPNSWQRLEARTACVLVVESRGFDSFGFAPACQSRKKRRCFSLIRADLRKRNCSVANLYHDGKGVGEVVRLKPR